MTNTVRKVTNESGDVSGIQPQISPRSFCIRLATTDHEDPVQIHQNQETGDEKGDFFHLSHFPYFFIKHCQSIIK